MEALNSYLPEVESAFQTTTLGELHKNPRTEFTTPQIVDAQLFTNETIPKPMRKNYEEKCFKPPALAQLDKYLENGGSCLQNYTNPQFFLESWINEQNKLRLAAKEERRKRREERRAQQAKDSSTSSKSLGPKKPKKLTKVVFDPNTGEKIIVKDDGDTTPSASTVDLRGKSVNSTLQSSSSQANIFADNPPQFTFEDAPPPPPPDDDFLPLPVVPPSLNSSMAIPLPNNTPPMPPREQHSPMTMPPMPPREQHTPVSTMQPSYHAPVQPMLPKQPSQPQPIMEDVPDAPPPPPPPPFWLW